MLVSGVDSEEFRHLRGNWWSNQLGGAYISAPEHFDAIEFRTNLMHKVMALK